MKMLKKTFTLLICFCLLSLSLVGCKSNTDDTSSNQGDNQQDGMKDVTYRVMLKQGIAEYPADGGEAKKELQRVWKDKLGITNTDYQVVLAGGGDYNTKLNTMLAGGDIPDYFQIDIQDLQLFVDNNMIVPIDEYIEKMPNVKKLFSMPSAKASYDNFMIDGKHYGFIKAYLPGELNTPSINGLTLRTDWLEKLGLEKPKTLDELHDTLYAFTYNDPDGNGSDDTYGFGGNRNQMFSSVFGAYGIYLNGINSWAEVDGELVHSTVMPETKEVLALLREWYKEGLIDPDKFVVEAKQSKDKFIGGKFGVMEQSLWWANDARISWEGSGTGATCEFIRPIEGPDGKNGYPVNPIKTSASVISRRMAESKDIDRFLKILDLMAQDTIDGMRLVKYGKEGEHYEYVEESETIIKKYHSRHLYKLGYSNPIRWINIEDNRWIPLDDPRAKDYKISKKEEDWVVSPFCKSVPALKDFPDLYTKLWAETFTKIITGTVDIDEWDVYVEKFYKQGGKELTEQANEEWKKQ